MNFEKSAKVTLWCCRILVGVMVFLLAAIYHLVQWYSGFRDLLWQAKAAIVLGFYLCAPAVLYALLCMDALLRQILAGQVFVTVNVRFIRRVRWCCAWVSLISVASGFLYPPLLFLAAIMAFLALSVSVVKNVMAAAVEIREENDLTV